MGFFAHNTNYYDGLFVLALYHLQMPAIFYYNKTAMLPLFRFLGAFSNIVLNIVLIPFWGIYGAAIATTLSFIIMTIPMFIYTKMFFTIQYNWFLIILYICYTFFIYYLTVVCTLNIFSLIFFFFIGLTIIIKELKKIYSLLLKNI